MSEPDKGRGWGAVLTTDRAGLRDYWDTFVANKEEIEHALLPLVESHPVFGPVVRAIPPDVRAEQDRQGQERTRRAIVDGEWADYEEHLRFQGRMYAMGQVDFTDWYELTGLVQRFMVPVLVREFGDDPTRLSHAIVAMQAWTDQVMSVIAEEYLSTKERAIDEQRKVAQARADALAASEAALREKSAILDAVLFSMRDGVVVADTQGNILLRNRVAEKFARPTERDAGPVQVFEPDETTPVPDDAWPIARAARGETCHDQEIYLRFPTGRGVHLSCDGSPLRGRDDHVMGSLVVFRDISGRREMEAERRRSALLELENTRIREATQAKSRFLASMSHELRTPLNAVIGFSELLERGLIRPDSPDYAQCVADILSSGRHLLRLVNDVLDLAKVESGRMEFHPETLRPAVVVDEVCSILRTSILARRVHFLSEVSPEVDTAFLDAARLKQVLYNYLSNALKFVPERGHVTVRVLPAGPDAFRLEVEDDGPGIAPEHVDRLFTEFLQLHTPSAGTVEGTGLGLALTRRIVEAQGGEVGVRTQQGRGSTFFAVLPRRARVEDTDTGRRTYDAGSSAGPLVLVVEDDAADRDAIAGTLASAGYGVVAVATGAEALRIAAERHFDAFTVDLLLPDTSGLEVIRKLREMQTYSHVPVLVVTVVAERGAVAGVPVNAVLRKPLEADDLLRELSRAGVRPTADGAVLVVDDDPASQRLMEAVLQHLGLRCVRCPDGASALRLVDEHPPVAAIVDLLMPGMDGFELLDRLRRDPRLAALPVLVWTSKDLSSTERERLRTQAQAIVRKGGASMRSVAEHLHAFAAGRRPKGG